MPTVAVDIDGHVAHVRLSRPEKRNAVNLAMFGELGDCARELGREPGVRAVVLAGDGPAFCAGLDLSMLDDADPEAIRRGFAPRAPSPANLYQSAAWAWRELPVPVICALHGVAFGAGLQIALGADLRIAAPETQLAVMEVRWGLVPDMALSVTARGLVAPDVLLELACTGRVIDAAEGQRLGLVTAVRDEPLAAATALAREIASRSPDAIRGIKALLGGGPGSAIEEALALEARLQAGVMGRPNQREAVRANLEKREPRFD